MIPKNVTIQGGPLPSKPGVYLMSSGAGKIIYVGKAAVIRTRVSSYWNGFHTAKTERLKRDVASISYKVTDTALEALILEANLIKKYRPHYNILGKDDRSFLYVCVTDEPYPRILLKRGHELQREKDGYAERGVSYKKVYGPYLNGAAVRAALEILRRIFVWSACRPGQARPCFDYQLGKCLGVCVGRVTPAAYRRVMRHVMLFLEGRKQQLLSAARRQMRRAAAAEHFEEAARLRNELYSLAHINDVAMLKKDAGWHGDGTPSVIFGRVEGYDISHISGTSAAGGMVVFENGEPKKSAYRRFKIKTVSGPDDYESLREVLRRRLHHKWPLPDVFLIDGGRGQVRAAQDVLRERGVMAPVVGIAKGAARKKNEFVLGTHSARFARAVLQSRALLIAVRDEAHRFAHSYHRLLRSRRGGLSQV